MSAPYSIVISHTSMSRFVLHTLQGTDCMRFPLYSCTFHAFDVGIASSSYQATWLLIMKSFFKTTYESKKQGVWLTSIVISCWKIWNIYIYCQINKSELNLRMGASIVKWTKQVLVYKSRGFLGQRPISSSKMLFRIGYFSWWSLLFS